MRKSKTSRQTNKQKFWVRVLCIVLCTLLAGSAVVSVLMLLL